MEGHVSKYISVENFWVSTYAHAEGMKTSKDRDDGMKKTERGTDVNLFAFSFRSVFTVFSRLYYDQLILCTSRWYSYHLSNSNRR